MPIYEYRCTNCGHRFERWQKMSDPDPDHCPECAAGEVERLISAVGFRFKGGGWYETDFKKSNRHNIAGDEAAAKKGEKTESGKAEKSTGDAGNGDSKTKTSVKSSEKKPATSRPGETAA